MSGTTSLSQSASYSSPKRNQLLWPVMVTILLCAGTYTFSPNFRPATQFSDSPYAGDFLQEWIGGYIVRAGDRARFYDVPYARSLEHDSQFVGFAWDDASYLPIVYPPFYYLLISPLSLLPFRVAAGAWAAMMLSCFAATAMLLGRATVSNSGALAGWRDESHAETWERFLPWMLPLAVLFAPMLENLTTSQKGTVCLLILTGTYLLLSRERSLAAGIVFGLLAFKPQLTLVIALAMLFKGQWRFVLGGAATGITLVGLSFLVGTDVCVQYVQFSTGATDYIQTGGYDLHKSHCLYGFFTLLAGGQSTLLVKMATLIAAICVIGLIARLLHGRFEPGRPRFAIQYSGLVIATVLLSPHLFTYDLTLLLLPMFLLFVVIMQDRELVNRNRALPWLMVLLYGLAGISPRIALQTGVQISTIVMLTLLILLSQITSDRRSRAH